MPTAVTVLGGGEHVYYVALHCDEVAAKGDGTLDIIALGRNTAENRMKKQYLVR